MRIYDTLSRDKKDFDPPKGTKIKMFVCGPTVYDYVHIGNARTFVFFDFVAKYLRFKGFDVDYIQNITDIDDKIISKAIKAGKEPAEIAKIYETAFHENMKALGVTSVSKYARATDFMPEIISQVKRLIENGNAYKIDGDGWYFDLKTFSEYGKLSGRTTQMADDAVSRIDENDKKRNRGDFCLWKFSKEDEPTWPAEFGAGRPGWHIEDTAITERFLGPQYDIHGGGQDLIFPHHEAEIAQQCSVSGIKPENFVKYWMHTGFLVNKEQKMSKSVGNFMTVREALEKYSPEVLRYYFLAIAHYRSPLDFDLSFLGNAESSITKISNFKERIHKKYYKLSENPNPIYLKWSEDSRRDFKRITLDDDFNIPEFVAVLFTCINKVNDQITKGQFNQDMLDLTIELLGIAENVLGIIPHKSIVKDDIPEEVQKLVKERQTARENKNMTLSDELRQQINSLGFQIDDTPYGPLIKKK
jgi:cysteinyl-tRNA synthetase